MIFKQEVTCLFLVILWLFIRLSLTHKYGVKAEFCRTVNAHSRVPIAKLQIFGRREC